MDSRLGFGALLVVCVGCGPQVDEGAGSTSAEGSSSGGDVGTTAGEPEPGTSDAPVTTTTTTTDEPTTSGPAETTGDVASTGVADSSSGDPFELDCTARCSDPIDGSCVQDCAATCEAVVGGHPEEVADAFEACVASEPLCFSFLEDCMWAELYEGEAVEQLFTLEGSDFVAWEGATVYARLEAGEEVSDTVSAQITFGGFNVQTTVETTFDVFFNPRTFYFFVDVDEDGECTPGTDYVRAAMLTTLGTNFFDPTFFIEATSDGQSVAGFCNEF